MTLDEAIRHAREVAKENREREKLAVQYNMPINKASCAECAKEHEQLADWLKDYKRLLEMPKQDRPKGEWIVVSRNFWKCPYCQELTNEGKNFCPNCGADMRKEEAPE